MLNSLESLYTYVETALDPAYSGSCLTHTWGELESMDQLSVIAWLWLMGYADGDLDRIEERFIESLIA